jgi:hypothetical protein
MDNEYIRISTGNYRIFREVMIGKHGREWLAMKDRIEAHLFALANNR